MPFTMSIATNIARNPRISLLLGRRETRGEVFAFSFAIIILVLIVLGVIATATACVVVARRLVLILRLYKWRSLVTWCP